MKILLLLVGVLAVIAPAVEAAPVYQIDSLPTSEGPIEIMFIGHGSLMFNFADKKIYVDPVSDMADYGSMPKADIILITHEHKDHLDPKAVGVLRTEKTQVVLTEECAKEVTGGLIMHNGDAQTVLGLKIEAVPAYNIVHMRSEGQPFHPKGRGNGYVLTFGDKRVYVAGDTENIPEMKLLKAIDVAFLPMNLPYTMTPEMAADAAKGFRPKVLYPYHYGDTDTSKIEDLLKNETDIEVHIRKMK